MVIKKKVIIERLKQLDTVLQELALYQDKGVAELASSLSLRWTVERGLIAAANLVFDVSDHILSGHFGVYPETYEDSLRLLPENKIISANLYRKLKGLGGFRNVLVHEYLAVNIEELSRNLGQAFQVFPAYSAEIQKWLGSLK